MVFRVTRSYTTARLPSLGRSNRPTRCTCSRSPRRPPHLAARRKGATSLGGTSGGAGKVHPPGARCHPTEIRIGGVEHGSQACVSGTFLWSEVEVQRDRVEAGEKTPGEVGDGKLEAGGSHKLGEAGSGSGVARRSRREAEPSIRHCHLEGFIAEATAEVMDFVHDEEAEAIPELVHVPVRALEGGDRQRRQLTRAVAIAADGSPIHEPDLPKPLIEQYTGRDQTQRAQLRPVHGGEGEPGLTTAGRKSDDAAMAPQFPGGQGGFLVGPEVDVGPRLCDRAKGRGNVLESGTALEEPALEARVSAGGGPMGADARIPQDARRLGEVEVLGRIGQQDGAAIEQQLHGESVTRVRVPARSRSEEHTSELQSLAYLVCRLLLAKKKTSPQEPPRHHPAQHGR